MVVAGVMLLGVAWWRLRTRALHAALLWSAPLLLAPPMFSRDVYAYAGQGLLVAEGLDPYDVGPGSLSGPLVDGVDDVWIDTPSPYGPLWLALAGGVVRLTGDRLLPALLGMRLLAVLGLLLAAWALHRLGGERALWLGVANPLVLLHLVGGAHNEALMIGLLMAGLALRERSLALAAVLITLGALVKLPAVAGLAFVVMAVPGGWGARGRAALVVGACGAATAVLVSLGSGLGWGWLTTLDAGRARLSLLSVTTGLGLALPGGDATLEVVLMLGLVAGAALATVLLWHTPRLGAVRAAGLTLLAVALLLPVVQPWYVLWGIVPLAAAVTRREAAALGAFCLVVALLVLPSGRYVVRPPLYGVPMLLAGAVAVLVLRKRDDSGDRLSGANVEQDVQAPPPPRRSETL